MFKFVKAACIASVLAVPAHAATVEYSDGSSVWKFGNLHSSWNQYSTVTAEGRDLTDWDGTGTFLLAEFDYFNAVNAAPAELFQNRAFVEFTDAEVAHVTSLGFVGLIDFHIDLTIDVTKNANCAPNTPYGCPDHITYEPGQMPEGISLALLDEAVAERGHGYNRLSIVMNRGTDFAMTAVPVPAGGLLLGTALAGFAFARRRRS